MMDKANSMDPFTVYGLHSPLVGRDRQLHQLNELASDAISDIKHCPILILGNQGVGKSRLLAEWIEGQISRRPKLRVFRTFAESGDGPYEMWTRLLGERFKLPDHEEVGEIQQALREKVFQVFEDRRLTEILHFLGTFLEVRFQDNPFLRAMEADPVEHDRIARTVLLRFLQADAAQGAMILVFESIHLADRASLELLAEIASASRRVPLILVGLGRPELLGIWPRRPDKNLLEDWHQIELSPLSEEAAEELLRTLLVKLELPDGFVRDAVAMTGGNPYFMEQLVRLMITQQVISITAAGLSLDLSLFEKVRLPLSVEEAVQARIAALDAAERTILQMAAVMGNVFWLGAVTAMSRLERGRSGSDSLWRSHEDLEIRAAIDDLVERDYLMRMPDSWVPQDTEYAFKHNMEFMSIVSRTDQVKVRRWHLMAAQWLETRLGHKSEEHLETLAQHYREGGDERRAARCYIKAADMARTRFANEQAIHFYTEGLSLLDPDDALAKIDALHNKGDVCALTGRTNEALECFEEMLWFAYLLDVRSKAGAALGRIGRIHRTTGQYEKAVEHYETAQRLFLGASDLRGVAATLDDLGKVMWLKGDYNQALILHKQALKLRAELDDDRSTAFTLGNIGVVYQDSGRFSEALFCFQKSMEIRERIGDRQGMIQSAAHVGLVWLDMGETERAVQIWQEALKEARGLGDRLQQAYLLADLGDVERRLGRHEKAHKDLSTAIEIAEALGDRRLLSEAERKLGELLSDQHELEQAQKHIHRALELAESSNNPAGAGTAQRAAAVLSFKRKMFAEAEQRFQKAMEIFSGLGHHLEVARSCESMAAYHEEMGETRKASELRDKAEAIRSKLLEAVKASAASSPEDGVFDLLSSQPEPARVPPPTPRDALPSDQKTKRPTRAKRPQKPDRTGSALDQPKQSTKKSK